MSDSEARLKLVQVLEQQAASAEQLMDEARHCLSDNDQDGYLRKLKDRLGLILALPKTVGPLTAGLPSADIELVESWIGELVEDAGHALRVESPFYMSVLLYDGPVDEANNDIGRLADKLRRD